ncbi:DUF3302 domain-containing protein [Vibrio barjaei]|jgi:hypothetical protein|uniref:DUF3302 domain-containing protein n=1 Tax=Vibrio barjaei TaxID=1676683 RepID=UPI0007BC7450|nr:DUF3302 domain-containing protein [Vibrio barjaei]OIN29039.1 hypothetical protein AWH66_2007370 [Vibrio barjaei]
MNLTLDYASLAILFVVLLILIYGLIILHDIPYEIAKKRNHPHADAIHVAGWISLFFLHVMWPVLWVWATMYDADKQQWLGARSAHSDKQYQALVERIDALEKSIKE